MESIIQWIIAHAEHAHWLIFGAILLAGFNIPISCDALILVGALLAANVIPEHTPHLFAAVAIGCYLSAWGAYWLGRLAGPKLIGKWISPLRMEKIKSFYERHGLMTLILGRFIPFGVRNCIFMSAGMSKLSFRAFAIRDALASLVWTSTVFSLFFIASQNYQTLWNYMKTANVVIFGAFSLVVIGFLWYKMKKKPQSKPVA